MSFPKYPAYKDGEDPMIGHVPQHWTRSALKHLACYQNGYPFKPENWGESGRPIIRIAQLTGDAEPDRYAGVLDERVAVYHGDLLFSWSATLDSFFWRGEAAWLNQHIFKVTPSEEATKGFLYYLIKFWTPKLADVDAHGSTMRHIKKESLGQRLFIPPLDEQRCISDFLDHETAKIDALVAEQENLITLLKEKRQAVISHAVTKGLDKSVPMKDSGVEWLGEVPAHWEVGSIKRFFSVLDSRRVPLSSEERSYRQGPYPYYGASGVIDYVDEFIFDEDLILVSEDGANLLSRSTPIAFIASGKYWVNNHAHILKPCDQSLTFWCERIETIDLTPVITGAAQPKLTIDALANLPIAVPPDPQERAAIDLFLRDQAQPLQQLIDQAEQGIALLQERRSALISAAVTGQIDVRGLAPEQEQAA